MMKKNSQVIHASFIQFADWFGRPLRISVTAPAPRLPEDEHKFINL